MKTFSINGQTLQVDESLTYLDFFLQDGRPNFFLQDGRPNFATLNVVGLCQQLQDGTVPVDNQLRDFIIYLERWTVDAPRKRFFRKARLEKSMTVLSGEYFFENLSNGDQIIDQLENTGKFADALLKIIGQNGLKRFYNRD